MITRKLLHHYDIDWYRYAITRSLAFGYYFFVAVGLGAWPSKYYRCNYFFAKCLHIRENQHILQRSSHGSLVITMAVPTMSLSITMLGVEKFPP